MRALATVTLLAAALASTSAPTRAQLGGGTPLSPAEGAAYEMSREFSFLCNPQRQGGRGESSSVVRRADDAMEGSAALLRSAEGTFLIVEGYDQQSFGHCLVLGWFGGALEPGTYPISRLAMERLEQELEEEEHSFFAMPAVRTDDENSILVTESGRLEIERMEGGRLEGTFTFTGVSVDRGRRGAPATWEGSFSAVEVDR